MKLYHDGTTGTARFSVRDDDGDVIQRVEVPFEVLKLTPQVVLAELWRLVGEREKLEEQLALQATPALNGAPPSDRLTETLEYTPTGE